MIENDTKQACGCDEQLAELETLSRFEEGEPADPTTHMSPEDKKKWEQYHGQVEHLAGRKPSSGEMAQAKALFKKWRTEANSPSELEDLDESWQNFKDGYLTLKELQENPPAKEARFEEGKPADPTDHMSPEDAKRWWEMHSEHKDKFKAAEALIATLERMADKSAPALYQERFKSVNGMLTTLKTKLQAHKAKQEKNPANYEFAGDLGHVESQLQDVVDFLKTGNNQSFHRACGDTLMSELEEMARFEEGEPADPTKHMSPEDAKKWEQFHGQVQHLGANEEWWAHALGGLSKTVIGPFATADAAKAHVRKRDNRQKFKSDGAKGWVSESWSVDQRPPRPTSDVVAPSRAAGEDEDQVKAARRVMLLTQADRKALPALYSQENNPDPTAVVKFFNPYGAGTWLATEFDGTDQFFGAVNLGHGWELGYFSLRELENTPAYIGGRPHHGIQGIERDRSFRPRPLSQAKVRNGSLDTHLAAIDALACGDDAMAGLLEELGGRTWDGDSSKPDRHPYFPGKRKEIGQPPLAGQPGSKERKRYNEWWRQNFSDKNADVLVSKMAMHSYVLSLAPDGQPEVDGYFDPPLFSMILAKVYGLRPNQVRPKGRMVDIDGTSQTWLAALTAAVEEHGDMFAPLAGRNVYRIYINVGSIYEQGMKAADYEPGKNTDKPESGPGVGTSEGSDVPDGEGNDEKRASDEALFEDTWFGRTAASGLYGFPKRIQADCEAAARRITRAATQIAKRAYQKDERVAEFLGVHAKRVKSLPAKVLLAALQEMGPKVAADTEEKENTKEAGATTYGLYGYPEKTATLGLTACSTLRSESGRIAAGLHRRRAERHAAINDFLKAHCKEARCLYSQLLLDSYPDAGMKLAAEVPQTVADWIAWDD